MDDSHRAFLQAIIARRTATLSEAKKLLSEIFEHTGGAAIEDITDGFLAGFVGDINDELSFFDFEIRDTRAQSGTREQIFAFVNHTSDPLTQGATTHSADEIAYFKRLLDAMFITNNTKRAEVMAVMQRDALYLAKKGEDDDDEVGPDGEGKVNDLTQKHAEELLEDFVKEGWLLKSRANWYSLAPRGLMELEAHLTSRYNPSESDEDEAESSDSEDGGSKRLRLRKCNVCTALITIGQRCSSLDCEVRMHDGCADAFFENSNSQKCPTCSRSWTGDEKVGEGAKNRIRQYVDKRTHASASKNVAARRIIGSTQDVGSSDSSDEDVQMDEGARRSKVIESSDDDE